MSNFQRTRSKVWWGDSPPNIGSPVAQHVKWGLNNRTREETEWEPQLPHWIANQPEQQRNNSTDNIARQNVQILHQWPLRHGSPGSHKSQDSGFSDSDSSPPPSQYYQSPENNVSNNTSQSSSDSNNNENITVKQVDLQNISQIEDAVDKAEVSHNDDIPTPKPRLRSSSVIQTPYDLQKYYEIHHDEEHMELLKDKENDTEQKYPAPKNLNNQNVNKDISKTAPSKNLNVKLSMSKTENEAQDTMTSNNNSSVSNSVIQKDTKDVPDKNINIISPSKKYPTKKPFISTENDNSKVIKLAKVKDLETSKQKSDESLEFLKLSDTNEIIVNNQPRVRTPISNVSYTPAERTADKKHYHRSLSNEYGIPTTTKPKFERNRLNKSLHFEAQRLDQQILDIQDGYHSLGYIDENTIPYEAQYNKEQIHKPSKALLAKNIMDSLNLKPTKKPGPKSKHRMATKSERTKEVFKIFPSKKEKPAFVDTHAGGVLNKSRVPFLGLPRTNEHNNWVIVGYPEQELLIPHYNERLVATESDLNLRSKDKVEDDVNNYRISRLTPPPQFQDKQIPYKTDSQTDKNLTHDSKREKLKDEEINFFDGPFLGCTSTPKTLATDEFMNSRRSERKNPRRVNLLPDFNVG